MKNTFTVIVSIFLCSVLYATGISNKNMGGDNVFILPAISGTEISQTDSLINADKKIIIKKVVHEVFTNYSDSIQSIKKNYGTMSIMSYIDRYIQRQNDTIETRISNKSYIHRFASTENLWIDTDYSDVAARIKERTLDRIKEISEDIDRKVPNGLNTITNDKEELLEKEVNAEIKE